MAQNTASEEDLLAPPQANLDDLQKVLDNFDITIAEANDLVILEDYEIVVIADDSGSMQRSATPAEQRQLGQKTKSRWEEMRDTLGFLVDLGACFDKSGLDIFFLNRPELKRVKNRNDPDFVAQFKQPPDGSTPLTECIKRLGQECGGEKPILLFILTDGEPDGGPGPFIDELRKLVTKQSTSKSFKVQIMVCTPSEGEVAWLNDLDAALKEVDVTDDYYIEKGQVMAAKKTEKFTRGDWCLKALLGPVSQKFDKWDEKQVSRAFVLCNCTQNGGCTIV